MRTDALLLDERILADGTHARTWASVIEDRVQIRDDDGTTGELSVAALDRVMNRYGKPLDEGVTVPADAESLALPDGHTWRRLRFHAAVDATGRDYLVWERPGVEPLCAVATMVTAAIRYLVLRLAAERPQESEAEG
ncbi:MAG TPA: hypothetical protein VFQ53_16730 [Kofleriaceae bacterium]|nr:hypothetical protein [Kofleriaceae bacterium]